MPHTAVFTVWTTSTKHGFPEALIGPFDDFYRAKESADNWSGILGRTAWVEDHLGGRWS